MAFNKLRFISCDSFATRLSKLHLLFLLCLLLPQAAPAAAPQHWVATWGAAQHRADGADNLAPHTLDGATLRQVVHISVGGKALRLHISNVFGDAPLVLQSVQVATSEHANTAAAPKASTPVLFSGRAPVSIPSGAEYDSDPVALQAAPLSDVVVTITIGQAPAVLTIHSGSHATSYLRAAGATQDTAITHWYFLAGLEVDAAPNATAVIAFGDSITDGHAATTDGNDRWPDVLARRVATQQLGVVNQGIGGNCILITCLGQNALARFDRDVLAPAAAHSLIVLEGINDIGSLDRVDQHPQEAHDALVERLEAGLQQIAERAHAHGMRVYGATLTPFLGSDYYHPSDRTEADRQALNHWIRTTAVFDGVIDFDAMLRDPDHPGHLTPAFDSGDHLHPGPAGYKRMGEGIPVKLLTH